MRTCYFAAIWTGCGKYWRNLFENAFKYGDGRRIKLEFYEEDYCQLIQVFNTGEPVSDNDFNHIFESFFRGSNSRGKQGNGLRFVHLQGNHAKDGRRDLCPERRGQDGFSFWFCGKYFFNLLELLFFCELIGDQKNRQLFPLQSRRQRPGAQGREICW